MEEMKNPQKQQKKSKKGLILAIVGLIVVIGVAIAAYFLAGSGYFKGFIRTRSAEDVVMEDTAERKVQLETGELMEDIDMLKDEINELKEDVNFIEGNLDTVMEDVNFIEGNLDTVMEDVNFIKEESVFSEKDFLKEDVQF
ncbi:hypothetical protein GF366_01415 [Candidatus Peregrinibacteria bacterium]|nr:hypothetical protein [Candidatus Peregrinibacteria bacterium]